MILTAVPATLVFPYIQLMPVFARDVWDIGASGLGALMAASGVGALTGALIAATMDRVERKGIAVMLLTTIYCAAVAAFAANPTRSLHDARAIRIRRHRLDLRFAQQCAAPAAE
ncbi:MAG: MFS transporter [Thermomicrobiales bacterium]|nr:MFS transporter [Thermomicrobiales bacterium]